MTSFEDKTLTAKEEYVMLGEKKLDLDYQKGHEDVIVRQAVQVEQCRRALVEKNKNDSSFAKFVERRVKMLQKPAVEPPILEFKKALKQVIARKKSGKPFVHPVRTEEELQQLAEPLWIRKMHPSSPLIDVPVEAISRYLEKEKQLEEDKNKPTSRATRSGKKMALVGEAVIVAKRVKQVDKKPKSMPSVKKAERVEEPVVVEEQASEEHVSVEVVLPQPSASSRKKSVTKVVKVPVANDGVVCRVLRSSKMIAPKVKPAPVIQQVNAKAVNSMLLKHIRTAPSRVKIEELIQEHKEERRPTRTRTIPNRLQV